MSREFRKEYHRKRPLRIAASLAILAALVVIGIYSLCVNSFDVSFSEAVQAIRDRIDGAEPSGYIEEMIDYVVIDVDAPRAVAAVAVGTILAVCGAVMQTVTRNPLAEPYTIGISSAAMLGVTISVVYGATVAPWIGGDLGQQLNAFVFAMIPSAAIVAVSSFKRLSPNMMVLVGIGMMYMFNAVSTFIKFNASDEDLQTIYTWSLGTLSKVDWDSVPALLAAAALVFFGSMLLSGRINVLMSGDKVCQSLGVNPVRLRIACFLMISVGVAVCVSYTGTIGFVGLVAPHMARIITGNNNRLLIPVAAMLGSVLVIVGDVVVRSLPGGLPVGVVTALIGSPIFLYFLFKQRRSSAFRFRSAPFPAPSGPRSAY